MCMCRFTCVSTCLRDRQPEDNNSVLPQMLFIFEVKFICFCWGGCACHGIHVEVRGHVQEVVLSSAMWDLGC